MCERKQTSTDYFGPGWEATPLYLTLLGFGTRRRWDGERWIYTNN